MFKRNKETGNKNCEIEADYGAKAKAKPVLHFCADDDTIETLFRTVVSVNQRSIHHNNNNNKELSKNFLKNIRARCFVQVMFFEITKQTESLVESADLLDVQILSQTNEKEQADLLDKHKERVENLPDEEN